MTFEKDDLVVISSNNEKVRCIVNSIDEEGAHVLVREAAYTLPSEIEQNSNYLIEVWRQDNDDTMKRIWASPKIYKKAKDCTLEELKNYFVNKCNSEYIRIEYMPDIYGCITIFVYTSALDNSPYCFVEENALLAINKVE